ncbi:ribokinase [Pedococcus dokdonensis]|uniref:Ribokinase n=1 Tax=Pedococcus dokdonensis TaxID=443156 RepID=A0A1H0TWV1_9MICO|nr:ribokinase [Pedococcus dokdonensis]
MLVVGSINVDLSLTCPRLPAPGETLLADSVHRSAGGKGANQAVGAARAGGAATTLIGAVGDDADGATMLAALVSAGVDCDRVARSGELPTGLALITVDHAAENTIVVAAGANASVRVTEDDQDVIAAADVILAQLEVPQQVVVAAARRRRDGVPLVLNAAPSAPLTEELVAEVDVLVVNEHEARDLSGIEDLEAATAELLQRVPAVLVTLGAAGAQLHRQGAAPLVVPAPEVEAVDTVAAGDTFCGAFAAALARGEGDLAAMRLGAAAASLAVQRRGAQSSVPTLEEARAQVHATYGRQAAAPSPAAEATRG